MLVCLRNLVEISTQFEYAFEQARYLGFYLGPFARKARGLTRVPLSVPLSYCPIPSGPKCSLVEQQE